MVYPILEPKHSIERRQQRGGTENGSYMRWRFRFVSSPFHLVNYCRVSIFLLIHAINKMPNPFIGMMNRI